MHENDTSGPHFWYFEQRRAHLAKMAKLDANNTLEEMTEPSKGFSTGEDGKTELWVTIWFILFSAIPRYKS